MTKDVPICPQPSSSLPSCIGQRKAEDTRSIAYGVHEIVNTNTAAQNPVNGVSRPTNEQSILVAQGLLSGWLPRRS